MATAARASRDRERANELVQPPLMVIVRKCPFRVFDGYLGRLIWRLTKTTRYQRSDIPPSLSVDLPPDNSIQIYTFSPNKTATINAL